MVNSYLITATNYEERIEKAKKLVGFWEPHPDFLLIQAHPSISINDIRQIQKFLSRRPYQAKIKAVVLAEAELMTIPAQNAFLKTLEEPPANSLIVLGSQNQDQLLATIISRCQIINLKSKPVMIDRQEMNKHYSLYTKILKSSPGKRLQLIEPYIKSREEASEFCQQILLSLRAKMRDKNQKKSLPAITQLQKAIVLIQANINLKLILENLLLKL